MALNLTGKAKVYLNGTMILDLQTPAGGKRIPPTVFLKPNNLKLLKAGENILAVELEAVNKKLAFDCGLKAHAKSAF